MNEWMNEEMSKLTEWVNTDPACVRSLVGKYFIVFVKCLKSDKELIGLPSPISM